MSDTYADSHSPDCHFICSRRLASETATHKTAKYVSIASTYHFVPVAIETYGVFDKEAEELLKQVGHGYTEMAGDPNETSYLLKQISVAIQRSNVIALHGAFAEELYTNNFSMYNF